MRIRIKAKPNSKKEIIKKIENDYFEVKVSAPPENGKANTRLIELLSKYFKLPKSKIQIIKGGANKNKIIELDL